MRREVERKDEEQIWNGREGEGRKAILCRKFAPPPRVRWRLEWLPKSENSGQFLRCRGAKMKRPGACTLGCFTVFIPIDSLKIYSPACTPITTRSGTVPLYVFCACRTRQPHCASNRYSTAYRHNRTCSWVGLRWPWSRRLPMPHPQTARQTFRRYYYTDARPIFHGLRWLRVSCARLMLRNFFRTAQYLPFPQISFLTPPASRLLPSPRSRPLKSSYGVWGAGFGAEPKPKSNF